MTEASFEELYQNAACGHLSIDADDVITGVNETFLGWTGYSLDAVIGVPFRDLLTVGSQIFYETRYQPVLRLSGEAREVALTLRRANGSGMPILVNAKIADGFPGVRMAIFDSTERQDYERELLAARRTAELSEERVRVLRNASIALVAANSEEELANALVVSGREAFSASDGAVILYDEVGALRVVAGGHLQDALLGLQLSRPDNSAPPPVDVFTIGSLREADAFSRKGAGILRSIRAEGLSVTPLIGDGGAVGGLVLFYGRSREFDAATLELHEAIARQAALVLARIRLQVELEQMALHDQLTGLANRNLLRERLAHALASADRTLRPMSLLFLDLDGFKGVNDAQGHRVGDGVLQVVAARINGVVREADIVGRFGGDEFLIICEDADEHAARLVADRVATAIAQPFPSVGEAGRITASIGVAVFVPSGDGAPSNDLIVRIADAAMYESKNAGRGQTTVLTL